MPKELNTPLRSRFIGQYDDYKPGSVPDYSRVKSVTDQRCIINTPQELYEQYVLGSEIFEELENEVITDFDNDVYDYEDRGEYGVDVAASKAVDPVNAGRNAKARRASPARPESSISGSAEALSGDSAEIADNVE